MITCRVITGLPGSGKTERILREIATNKGKYVFATSRTDLIDECAARLRALMPNPATSAVVNVIHGEALPKLPVLAAIADAARVHENTGHVVVFITHEGMIGADLSGFSGWNIIIDENPSAISSGAMKVPSTASYLATVFDLAPLAGTKWSKLVPKAQMPPISAIIQDDYMNGLVTFQKRAMTSQGVYVDVDDWSKVIGSHKRLQWWSAWTPADLSMFASVTILGAGFFESLCYKATQSLLADKVTFTPDPMPPSTERACPTVLIHYFTRHRGSTKFWTEPEGERCLLAVADHLKMIAGIGYWTANEAAVPYLKGARMSGTYVSPRQEGTNSLIAHTSCAMIYSAKATPSDGPAMEVFGLGKADVERAREQEDIIQFALRGALRRPDFDGTYSVYLYSLDQAEMLATYLEKAGLASVELVPVEEAGIMDVARVKTGRRKDAPDKPGKAEQQEKRRKKDAERQSAKRARGREAQDQAGTRRPVGRPREVKPISPQTAA